MDLIAEKPLPGIFIISVMTILVLIGIWMFVEWFEKRNRRRFEQLDIKQGFVRKLTKTHRLTFLGPPQFYVTVEHCDVPSGTHNFVEYEIDELTYNCLIIDLLTHIRPGWKFVKLMTRREYRLEEWIYGHSNACILLILLLVGVLLLFGSFFHLFSDTLASLAPNTNSHSVTVYVCNKCGVATETETDKCSYCGEGKVTRFTLSSDDPNAFTEDNNYGFRKRVWVFKDIPTTKIH